MQLLGIDIGSSSVKCAVLKNGRVFGEIVHAKYAMRIDGARAEAEPAVILKAIAQATRDVGSIAKHADAIALSVFSPGWVAMDAAGKPVTPIVTHADRRSVDVAKDLEQRVGQQRYLNVAGTRPFPGGISSTTWAWYLKHEPARLRKADLIGHLNTFLHRQLTGARVVDPANASFMGVYRTCDFAGWSDELCDAVGGKKSQLPEIRDANEIGGKLTRHAASILGLPEGTPMTVGVVDGSAGMLLTGARVGQLLNVCGSTDVLALCTNQFSPHPRLLTRALGIGKKWLSVSTIAAAGSAINWAKEQFFPDHDWKEFEGLALSLARRGSQSRAGKSRPETGPKTGTTLGPETGTTLDIRRQKTGTALDIPGNPVSSRFSSAVSSRFSAARWEKNPAGTVVFEPYLAGDRMSIEQRQAAFTGLTLATTREQMLAAILEALAHASAARIDLMKQTKTPIRHDVVVTGGAEKLTSIFHRDWPGKWSFKQEKEATLRGLWELKP